jgi:hypothetical protein
MNFSIDITQASLLTVAGGSAFVGLILLTLRGVLKEAWSENLNRYAALAMSLLLVEGITAYTKTTDAFTYVVGFFVACQITLAVLNGAEIVSSGIVRAQVAMQARRAAKAAKRAMAREVRNRGQLRY